MHKDKDGNFDMEVQAVADYRAAIARQPTAELYTELGSLLNENKDYVAAIDAYKKALDLNPEFLAAQVNYGSALVSIGKPDSAISFFSKVCAQSRPDHPETSGSCGNARIVASRGWAYFTKGDCPSLSLAEKDYSEAVSLAPENAVFHSLLGDVLLGEAGTGTKDLRCTHSKHEREDYLDRAWSQYGSAVTLDSANTMYREMFVIVSEVLKRKPEYEGGVATEPNKDEVSQMLTDTLKPDFPLTLTIDSALILNFAEKNPEALFQADQMGMPPPIHVIVYASLNGENHWRFTCHRENSHGERNPCTNLAPGGYPARWVHNRELLQILVKEGDAFGWRFLDVEPAPESPASPQDNVLRSETYQFKIRKPKDNSATDYPLLIHVYGAAKFRLPSGSLPARTHCSATSYTSYRTDVDCTNSGAVQLYKGFVTVEAAIDGNSEWWISCDAKWRWSKCSVLGPGFYPARWKDGPGSRLVVLAVENDEPHEVTFEAKQMPDLREPPTAQPPR
jgi:tetratricopeptide (TPR) repeat protein